MSVPVLSKIKLLLLASVLSTADERMRIPALLAAPMPAKNASGTEITKAQGQEITRKIKALFAHTSKPPAARPSSKIKGKIKAIKPAKITTTGV